MPELSVAIVAAETEQRSILQVMVDGTGVARTSQTFASFPVASADPILRKIHGSNPDVVLIDIPSDFHSAMRAIELVHQEIPAASIFAIGSMIQPQMIVTAMRAGAREFIERPTKPSELLEAFLRFSAAHRKVKREEMRGRMFTVVNAKGGSGGTTIAVNLALALQIAHGNVALIDASPLGHIALHLNLKPAFTVADAIQNLHRLDGARCWRVSPPDTARNAVARWYHHSHYCRAFNQRSRPIVRSFAQPFSLCRRRRIVSSGRNHAAAYKSLPDSNRRSAF